MISRFRFAHPTRWFGLTVRSRTGTGRVLMRPRDGGVDRHVPGDQPTSIRTRLQPGHDPRPDPRALPTAEQPVHRLPRPVTLRHIPPRRTHPNPPPNPVNE